MQKPIDELYKNKATLIQKARAHRQDAWQQETLGDYHKPGSPERKKAAHKANRSLKASNIAGKMAGHKFSPDEETIYESGGMSDEAHELVLHADNNSHLHHSSKTPIINNLKKKMKKGVYDLEKAKKLWGYHADRAAHSYAKEHGHPGAKWHQMFSTTHRKEAAAHWEKAHRDELSEQIAIHELSKKVLGSYVKKAASDMHSLGRAGGGPGFWDRLRKVKKREKSVGRAVDRLAKEETLDELSKKTLGSYVKKASSSLRDQAGYGGWLGAKDFGDKSVRKSYTQTQRMSGKRQSGIERAANRLTKEDTLDELSKKTLGSYIHKSAEDLEDAAGTETYAATKGRYDVADAMSKKASNRKIGIRRAARRLVSK